jgi:diguanylate cyclase (GGDEF)-like protein/PAS domain S-box-containing protein
MGLEMVSRRTPYALLNLKHFLAALLLVTLAAGLRVWPLQALESELPWLTFYPAVIAVALYAGLYGGLMATVLACLTVLFIWPLLVARPFIENGFDLLEMALFAIICALISYLAEAMHRIQKRLEQTESRSQATAQHGQFIGSIIDYMPNMIGYWDRDLRCRFANNAYREWFDKQPEEIIGITFKELTGENLFTLNEPHIHGVLAGESQRFERTLNKANGSVGHILGHYIPDFDADGSVKGFAIQASEVTELKETQAQLQLAAYVFDNTVDGVVITDAQGIILSVNPAFIEITGYTAEEAVGETPRILKSNRHDPEFYASMWEDINTKGQWSGEIWNRRKDGDVFLERLNISMVHDADGEPVRYVSIFSDITDRWRKDTHLTHLAFHDALTDLPNRTLLMERLEQKIIHSKRQEGNLALMFLDLDGFKLVNDQFGHNIGDDLLKVVAERLLTLVRQSDTVARIGGDEFIFMLNNPKSKEGVMYVANRVLNSINEPIEIRGEVHQIGTSIGIAIFPADGETSVELIKNADTAMYAAKSSGKNTVSFFSPEMSTARNS